MNGGNPNVHRNQATDQGGSNPSQRVCGWGGGVETDWTVGGAFKGVERSPSCRARRASDPQRGRRALPGLEQPDPAASTRLLFRLGSEKSWHFINEAWE